MFIIRIHIIYGIKKNRNYVEITKILLLKYYYLCKVFVSGGVYVTVHSAINI